MDLVSTLLTVFSFMIILITVDLISTLLTVFSFMIILITMWTWLVRC